MTFKHVIVGFDESAESIDALAFARDISEPGARMTLAQIFDPGFTGARAALYDEEIQARVDNLTRAAGPVVGDHRFDAVAVGGSPARQLNRLAHERNADLLVVGSTHHGPVGQVLAGSVADRLLHGSPCPVGVAPRGYAEGTGQHPEGSVVIGYDWSEESQLALAAGRRIALALGAKLRLVSGMRELAASPARGPYIPIVRSRFLTALERAESECEPELEVKTALVDGEPAEVLLRESADARIVIVGSRRYGPRLLLRESAGSIGCANGAVGVGKVP
jgi:nucleotide-binding universal stress UspA family protein